jgi:hypothetical protein
MVMVLWYTLIIKREEIKQMFNTLMTMIYACENDAGFEIEQSEIHLIVDDFFDFDEDGIVLIRDYDHPAEVSALLDWLGDNCISQTDDFYDPVYSFNGFTVRLNFTSLNI